MALKRLLEYLIISCVLFCMVFSTAAQNSQFAVLRRQMVKNQIEARGVTDNKVLQAMMNVERHRFVLPEYLDAAYRDSPLPIGEGQTISQPYIVAYMTEALDLNRDDKVLEIGTGSGYQAAVLAEICDSVFTIEIFESLGKKAKSLFSELGYRNIYTKIGDGYKGWPDYAPFDAIIVTCSPTHVPEPLKKQLAEGGRMIIPVGKDVVQYLVLLKKRKNKLSQETVLPVRFVPMISEEGKKY